MADTAAHLVDRVIPIVPVRQWVLSLPFALRYRMAYDARLTSDVLNVFIRALFGELRRRAHELFDLVSPQCGAVTFVQRFGDALNANVHFHPRLSPQKRPMVITSKPATVQTFGTRCSTLSIATKATAGFASRIRM